MNKAPRLKDIELIFKGLKKSRRELVRLAKDIPDEDAFATPYSILIDGINHIDELLSELKPAMKEAKEYQKQNLHQAPNRAKRWCAVFKNQKHHNDDFERND